MERRRADQIARGLPPQEPLVKEEPTADKEEDKIDENKNEKEKEKPKVNATGKKRGKGKRKGKCKKGEKLVATSKSKTVNAGTSRSNITVKLSAKAKARSKNSRTKSKAIASSPPGTANEKYSPCFGHITLHLLSNMFDIFAWSGVWCGATEYVAGSALAAVRGAKQNSVEDP